MKITLYLFLDWLGSFVRRTLKEKKQKRRWGEDWRDKTRPGRRYSRVEHRPSTVVTNESGSMTEITIGTLQIRPEPGWEWNCPNCKEYSIVTESMMPALIADWAHDLHRRTELAKARGVHINPQQKPTAATAGCLNCKYRPGAPE